MVTDSCSCKMSYLKFHQNINKSNTLLRGHETIFFTSNLIVGNDEFFIFVKHKTIWTNTTCTTCLTFNVRTNNDEYTEKLELNKKLVQFTTQAKNFLIEKRLSLTNYLLAPNKKEGSILRNRQH